MTTWRCTCCNAPTNCTGAPSAKCCRVISYRVVLGRVAGLAARTAQVKDGAAAGIRVWRHAKRNSEGKK